MNTTDMTKGLYRRVYAGFITGRRICAVSLQAEAWFWRIHAVADDFGNALADPVLLRNATVGRRADVTAEDVERWLVELVEARLVELYEVDGERYLHVVDFCERQPAGKNGKRVQKHPDRPGGDQCAAGDSGGVRVNPGESRFAQVTPGASSASHTHSHSHTKNPPTPQRGEARVGEPDTPQPHAPGKNGHSGNGDHANRAASKNGKVAADPPGFNRFWAEYPAKRRVARKQCASLWRREKLEDEADQILAALAELKSSPDWTKKEGQYVPNAHTWLNQRRWDAVGASGPPSGGSITNIIINADDYKND